MLKKLLAVFALLVLPAVAQNGSITGNLSASDSGTCETSNACLMLIVGEHRSVTFNVSGIFSGTVVFEAHKNKAATWVPLSVSPNTSGASVTSASSSGSWTGNTSQYLAVRVRCSAYTSGVVSVAINRGAQTK